MAETGYVVMTERGVLRLAGADVPGFLQGLVSNDMRRLGPGRSLHAALLTPQGKYLFDFFLYASGDAILLDGEGPRLADLARRLALYRLRAKVTIEDASEALVVVALIGGDVAARLGLADVAGAARPLAGGVVAIDPRLAALGARALLPRDAVPAALEEQGLAPLPFAAYERLRLAQGVPDGSRDVEVERSILLESGFEELNGVDFAKGCYVGQELTARTKHRALIKKRLLPVAILGPAPAPGTPVLLDGREVGVMRSSQGDQGLALLRLDPALRALDEGSPLAAGEARLRPRRPAWMRLPDRVDDAQG